MNLTNLIKQEVKTNKPKTLTRIKLGRTLSFIAALPVGTSPLFLLSLPMSMTVSPTLWVKDKMNDLKIWSNLR